jgi:hypothetical protein
LITIGRIASLSKVPGRKTEVDASVMIKIDIKE